MCLVSANRDHLKFGHEFVNPVILPLQNLII